MLTTLVYFYGENVLNGTLMYNLKFGFEPHVCKSDSDAYLFYEFYAFLWYIVKYLFFVHIIIAQMNITFYD